MPTSTAMTQEEILSKIYRDFARLAGEIAIDRCRNRVLLRLVRERLNVSDSELNTLFQSELQDNLEQFCHDITQPMLSEMVDVQVTEVGPADLPKGGGCCQGTSSCGG